jgi:oligoendopeptidase F
MLYQGLDDPKINTDLDKFSTLCINFKKSYKGNLNKKLDAALVDLIKIEQISSKLIVFFFLNMQCDTSNQEIKQKFSIINEKISKLYAENLTFFDIELGDMPESDYEAMLRNDDLVRKHKPFLNHIRKLRKHMLSEDVEEALTKRSPFIAYEWDDLMDELDGDMEFEIDGKKLNMSGILKIISFDSDSNKRAMALKIYNDYLGNSKYANLRTRALNVVMGYKAVSDADRGFDNPMQERNIHNRLDLETVEALHETVIEEGAKYAKRFYKILAKILGKDKLLWSDRNAPIPYKSDTLIDWESGFQMVLEAYKNFSPKMAEIISDMRADNVIDVPTYKGKAGGAFNYSIILPSDKLEGKPISFTFLNYLGTTNDVSTLAHELGHGVHGILAGKSQGALMASAPMVYAETASIFGERITFNYLLENLKDDREKLSLLMEKAGSFMNSVVRQISFSLFEQKAHKARREAGKLKTEDFTKIWMEVTEALYGKDGEVFEYKDMKNLWSYVSHFMRPFYVYAYAFGELFTHSLFAVKNQYPNFEDMYLNLLKAGSTKSAVELMQPFDLDPRNKEFWINGMNSSIKVWLDEIERIYSTLK